MLRAGWSSWRACLGWGIATLAISFAFGRVFPDALAHPLADSSITSLILAFEFARNADDLRAVFGTPGDPSHAARLTGIRAGNLLDYAFMLTYGSFLLAFFRASAGDLGERRWLWAGWLGPAAALSDAVENVILLSLNSDLAEPGTRLALLPWPVWIKFGLLGFLSGAASLALWRQRAWLLALPCMAAPLLAIPAIVEPHRWGQLAAAAVGWSWISVLSWAIWRAWRTSKAAQETG